MAGDWIKMRLDLQTHPKVVRILSAMRPHDVRTVTDKFRVIGGLHAVWSVFDTHSADGRLAGYTPELLDHIIGWEGFASAMLSVNWLEFDGAQTLVLPEFDEHNGQSGKRRAEDQKRKRNARKCPQDVRNMSDEDADGNGTREEKRREEKRREEKKEEKQKASAAPLPDWIPSDSWNAFVSMRKTIKKPLTADAVLLAIKKLEELRMSGNDPRAVLDQSIMNCWQGLFEVKGQQQAKSNQSHPTLGKAGQATAANLAAWLEESDATH